MLLVILTVKKLLERNKEMQNPNQKECRVEKVIKRKGDKLYILNGKVTIVLLVVGLIKKT